MSGKKLNAQPLLFDTDQKQRIDFFLMQLADQIGAPLIMLADISGRLVLYRGRLSEMQSTGLAALATGSFAAAAEIGKFLGLRNGFQQQLLEGDVADLYTIEVGAELLLIVAFTHQTMLGMVRLFTQQTIENLLGIIEEAVVAREAMADQDIEPLSDEFNTGVKTQLDDLFITD